jgi:4-carboxymuconolactone decarboxylase
MGSEKCESGKRLRNEMFGAVAPQQSPFRQPFEELVNGYCFGEIWARPGLTRKVRSMLTIAILTGLSRPNQLQAHVKGAIANGVTKEEIMEVIMHASIYCGIPAGADSFQQATTALKEIGLE